MVVQLDSVRKMKLWSQNLLVIDSKCDEAFPFSVVFFSKLENALMDFTFSFNSSIVLLSLEKF
jgi:hypothetical protein